MLIWVESPGFQGFGCSACDWKFRPVGALTDQSLDEMKKTFEDQRDREFAAVAGEPGRLINARLADLAEFTAFAVYPSGLGGSLHHLPIDEHASRRSREIS